MGWYRIPPLFYLVFWLAAIFCASSAGLGREGKEDRHALLIYGGLLARENWKSILFRPQDVSVENSQMIALAYAYTHWRAIDHRASMDVEAQVVRHFGLQSHFELNALPLVGRWHDFPWNDWVDTSAAFGLGLSYALSPPEAEAIVREKAQEVLFVWFIELGFASPVPNWDLVTRLHHRSGAFGIFGSPGKVGSDFVTVGLRHRF